MQSLPVMNIKPLLFAHKKSVIHFVLMKSVISIYNIFPYYDYSLWDFQYHKENYGTLNIFMDVGYVSFALTSTMLISN
jgi:hypothetical protein